MIRVGTAGWTVHGATEAFASKGTQLERYAQTLPCVEINSSFHRPHQVQTYRRWAAATPRHFRFSVKLPRTITHELRLRHVRAPLAEFMAQVAGLGRWLGPLLVQLPPSLEFDRRVARRFFLLLRELHAGGVACEPRHASWFTTGAGDLLEACRIGRVAADPAFVPAASLPGGWPGLVYYRWHGSPRRYWSVYEARELHVLADGLRALPSRTEAWCVFDNTAGGGAARNALDTWQLVATRRRA